MSETPAQIEATQPATVTVAYKDAEYAFPPSLDKASGDVLDAIDDMKLSRALRGLLSDADWKRFKTTSPLVEDYGGLFDAYAQQIGLGSAGE